MISMEDWLVIKHLKEINSDISNREIARDLGVSHNTVKAVLERNRALKYTRQGSRISELETFHDVIIEMLNAKKFKGCAIFNELKSKGYKGGKTSLYLYLSEMEIKAHNFSTHNETEPRKQDEINKCSHLGFYKRIEILVLYKYLRSINKVSQLTGHCRHTVRKVLKPGAHPSPGFVRTSVLDKYKDYIQNSSEEAKTASKLYEDI